MPIIAIVNFARDDFRQNENGGTRNTIFPLCIADYYCRLASTLKYLAHFVMMAQISMNQEHFIVILTATNVAIAVLIFGAEEYG